MTTEDSEYVLAIDLGTSGPKVAFVSMQGDVVGPQFEPVDLIFPSTGGIEQDPDDWWQALGVASRRLCAEYPDAASSVIGVAATAQWSGTVAVDESGRALHRCLIWMDDRGAHATEEVFGSRAGVAGYKPAMLARWLKLTGGVPAHSGKDTLSHLLWFERERPDIAAATAVYLEPKDWLNLQLTGRAVATRDSAVLYWLTDNRNPETLDWDDSLIGRVGIPRRRLPPLIGATDVVGPLTPDAIVHLGLKAAVPVIGGTPDEQSAAIGSGALDLNAGHLYVGTSAWITCHVDYKKTSVTSGIASLPGPLPGTYFVANVQETAGVSLQWLADKVIFHPALQVDTAGHPFQLIDALAARSSQGAGGVMFTPWLNGERTPVDDHTIRAGWHHVSLDNDLPDLVRAVLEGVAYNLRWLNETVEKFLGQRFGSLRFIGGGARSDLWSQIICDVLGCPIERVADPDAANLRGVAMLAGLALGRIDREHLGGMVAVERVHTPTASDRLLHEDRYGHFRSLYKANKALHRRWGGRIDA